MASAAAKRTYNTPGVVNGSLAYDFKTLERQLENTGYMEPDGLTRPMEETPADIIAHAHESAVVYGGSVYGDVVPDGHVVADFDSRFLIECVQHRAVLYIHPIAYADRIDVAAQHGAKPYTAFVAYDGVADENGIVGEETILSDFRGKAPYRFYKCHIDLY